MNNLCTATLSELQALLEAGTVRSVDIVRALKQEYEQDRQHEQPLHGFIEFFEDAEAAAEKADILRAEGKGTDKPLLGLPFAVKDNISMRGKLCTCCSKILDGYVAPFDAGVITRLTEAGAIPVGRTNMDEFAMGSSTEYSAYGPSRNPIDRSLTPGGSSGGSAAAVAGLQVPFALGTETGGSVRLPASYCGIYGLKPTYGAVSRYGVVAFGSSLDQVGFFARSVDDIGLGLSVAGGKDPRDGTGVDHDFSACRKLSPYSDEELKKLRIAVPAEFTQTEGLDKDVAGVFNTLCEWFRSKGVCVESVSVPVLEAAIPTYYVIALSEAASNLSRFDGIRYGLRKDMGKGYDELYTATRSEGFGKEVKRRIITGNYVLSHHFSGDCYENSLRVRSRMEAEIGTVLQNYDFIFCPTAPAPAFKLGEKVNDPLAMYLSDLFTTFVNLAHIPSLSIPAGKAQDGRPIGMQIAGAKFSEEKILRLAKTWEAAQV
ncbi:MAG: Asp-tRNA(Asn)/Glu-tRNA(Gln) amidotransferase subunit GatA [Treponema sp.]